MEFESFLKRIHERIIACGDAALSLDIRPYEGATAEELHAELAPISHELLEEAAAIVYALMEVFEGASPAEDSPHRAETGEAPSGASEHRAQISDLAFIAMLEFGQLDPAGRLHQISDPWEIIAYCEDANRRVAYTLTMLEQPIAALRNVERGLDPMSEVLIAIETRRHYARLAQSVLKHQTPENFDELKRALRAIGTAIAMLIGRDIYGHIRVHDRQQIRALQSRILDWLRDEHPPRTYADGIRLWGDLVGACQLLMQINRREDLVQHDGETIKRLLELDDPTRDRAALLTLRGLDLELDTLLEDGADAEAIRSILLRLSSTPRIVRGEGEGGASGTPTPLGSDPFAARSDACVGA